MSIIDEDALRQLIREEVLAAVADLPARPLAVKPQEAARLLGVSDSTFGRMVSDGRVRPVPHMSPPRYALVMLEAFVRGEGPVAS